MADATCDCGATADAASAKETERLVLIDVLDCSVCCTTATAQLAAAALHDCNRKTALQAAFSEQHSCEVMSTLLFVAC